MKDGQIDELASPLERNAVVPLAEAVAPEPGQVARVRSRRYLVEDVVPPPAPGEQTLVRLACLDDDAQGAKLEVLWEKEVDAQLLSAAGSWSGVAARGFDPPRLFAAYLHALEWNSVTSTDSRLLQAPFRAGIQVMAYQLEPLRKALRLPRVNLFIADDVGLGKTIEAGLIVRELLMRQKVRRIVVACPPSIVPQWREELESRFGLTFVVYDRDYVAARRRERGFGVNPWSTHSRFIVSHALLRDEAYAAPLRDWLGDFAPGTLLILDEAHNAAPASGAKYAVDSQLTRVVRDLAPRFEHRLFLSATPHNGHSNSFSALLELLDPQRFCRGVKVSDKLRDQVMVRRLKRDLREVVGGIKRREVVQIDVTNLPPDAPELRLSHLLADYTAARANRLKDARRSTQAAAALVTTSLQKRLLSSIEAFARTLDVHRRALERREKQEKEAATGALPLFDLLRESPGADDDRAELPEDDVQAEEDVQIEEATALSDSGHVQPGEHGSPERLVTEPAGDRAPAEETSRSREISLLDEMSRIAGAARSRPDPRIAKLVDWIRENQCPGLPPLGSGKHPSPAPVWNDRRVLVFTEYTDTKRYLEQQLRGALAGTDRAEERVATFHGGMNDESREDIKSAFNSDPARHPLRILLATDAAREGVNLQNHCADLFHFDLPWNPSRMEQRNGRIDRKGQREDVARCHYFFFDQRREDRVLQALVKKTDVIEAQLGSLSPVLERRLATLLDGGIAHGEVDRLARSIEAVEADAAGRAVVEEELEAARERKVELAAQIARLEDAMAASRKALNLSDDAFRDALSCSLLLLGAEPLTPVDAPDHLGRHHTFRFPALDRRTGADPSWATTLDTLRPRRKKDQKPWDWRRESPPRPVVFADSGTLDDDAVHLHLEHRVAQRLLGRFLSQGFVHFDLSRACVGQSKDPIPRVVVLGRLSLYGEGAARLHDEVVAVAARWSDPDVRKEPLKPYADTGAATTLSLLESSLLEARADTVPENVRLRLLASVERDLADLLPLLENSATRVALLAAEKLRVRASSESIDMKKLLEDQRARIEKELARHATLPLDFKDDERRQLEADRRHWQRRLVDLSSELSREPARILASYEVKATRIEPVGVAYLWPISG